MKLLLIAIGALVVASTATAAAPPTSAQAQAAIFDRPTTSTSTPSSTRSRFVTLLQFAAARRARAHSSALRLGHRLPSTRCSRFVFW